MNKIFEFVTKVLNVLEHTRRLYRKLRNIDEIERLEKTVKLYQKTMAFSLKRHTALATWIRNAAAKRERITEESVENAINEQDRS